MRVDLVSPAFVFTADDARTNHHRPRSVRMRRAPTRRRWHATDRIGMRRSIRGGNVRTCDASSVVTLEIIIADSGAKTHTVMETKSCT